MKHILRRHRLGISLAILAMVSSAPGSAQLEQPPPVDLVPFGAPVELDGSCAISPTVFPVEDGMIAVWHRAAGPQGVFARSGSTLDQLGPARQLNEDEIASTVAVAPLPGGFVAAWIRVPDSQIPEAVFQRFGSDLFPDAAEVVVGPASLQGTLGLVSDENGVVTIAYYGPAGTVQARRYTSTGTPVTVPIDVDPLVPSGQPRLVRLAAGDQGFLVAWEGALPAQLPGLWVRAFASNGVPAGASTRVVGVGAADFDIAWADDEYVAVVPNGNVWGYRIDAAGTPTAPEGLAAEAVDPHYVELAPGPGVLWLTFVETGVGLYASRIEVPSLAGYKNPALLVPDPSPGYLASASASASGGGLVAAWQTGESFPIPFPCEGSREIYAQLFGPANVVDVPTLPPSGLLGLALALAAGGLLLLRR